MKTADLIAEALGSSDLYDNLGKHSGISDPGLLVGRQLRKVGVSKIERQKQHKATFWDP